MDETFSSQIGERLRKARVALGLSQSAAATAVGVSREHWGRCERGLAVPGGEVLAELAKLGADIAYVLTGQRAFESPTPSKPEYSGGAITTGIGLAAVLTTDEEMLVSNYRRASEEARKAIAQTTTLLAQRVSDQ